MDGDPWDWGTAEVLLFFQHHAHLLLADKPNAALPDVTAFTQALAAHRVDGQDLLRFIDPQYLKDVFGVTIFNEATAVMHCIIKLQQRSQAWRYNHGPLASRLLVDTPAHTPLLPSDNIPVLPMASISNNAGSPEQPSRKRRKVEVVPVPLNEQGRGNIAQPTKIRHTDLTLYLPSAKTIADEQFFGPYRFGAHVGDFVSPPGMLVSADENSWHFCSPGNNQGLVHIAHDRMRHFIAEGWSDLERFRQVGHERTKQIDQFIVPLRETTPQRQSRRGKDTIVLDAITPSSALVVHEDTLQSYREKTAFLQIEYDYTRFENPNDIAYGPELQTPDELNSLLFRHHPDHSAYELEIDMAIKSPVSPEGDDEDIDNDVSDSEGSDMASVEDVTSITEKEASETLDRYIDEFVATWRTDRLPQLDEKKAFAEWSRMKKSRSLRDDLIERERATIVSLDRRLRDMRAAFLKDGYLTASDLRRSCANMDVTIQQREEAKWKLSVYQDPRQPHRFIKNRQTVHNEHAPRQSGRLSPMEVDQDDWLDFSPTTPTRVGAADYANLSPDAATLAGDGNEAEDELSGRSDTEDFIDDTEVIDLTSLGSSPLRPLPVSTPKLAPLHTKVTLYPDSGGDDLPSPSQFDFGTTNVKTTLKPRQIPDDPIVVSSDESSTLLVGPSRKQQKDTDHIYDVDAIAADPRIIAAWDLAILRKKGYWQQAVIKLLSKIKPVHREQILQMVGRDSKALKAHAQGIRSTLGMLAACDEIGNDQEVEDADDNVEIVQARVVLACYTYDDTMLTCELGDVLARRDLLLEFRDKTNLLEMFATWLQMIAKRSAGLFEEPKARTPKKKPKPLDERGVRQRMAAKARQTQAISQSTTNDAGEHVAVINPLSQEPIFIAPRIASMLKPHQKEGIQFMWRELTSCAPNNPGAEPEELVADVQEGCVLAHTMGLGKTCQTLALLIVIYETADAEDAEILHQLPACLRPPGLQAENRKLRTLVIVPVGLMSNWEREIQLWDMDARLGNVYIEQAATGRKYDEIHKWRRTGGILLMGYDYFMQQAGDSDDEDDPQAPDDSTHVSLDDDEVGTEEKEKPPKRKRAKRVMSPAAKAAAHEARKILRECTEIMVADEAHYLKNDKAQRSYAAASVETRARIGLTGTPMSNDVDEVYSIISWVAPGYLGPKAEFNARYAKPIKDGNGLDADPVQLRLARRRLKLLKEQIDPKVHRADITVLKGTLPPKVEFYVKLALSEEQKTLYRRFVDVMNDSKTSDTATTRIFSWLAVLGVLTTHPVSFKATLRDVKTENGCKYGLEENVVNAIAQDVGDDIDPARSAKTAMLLDILRLSKANGDKVLVFSHRLSTLAYLETLLTLYGIKHEKIQGEGMTPRGREETLAAFQDSRKGIDVLLVSTRSGGTGYNMQVANRVVIFDFSFDPAHENQAVGRAYRTGQKKPVFVYRLLAAGTFETNMENMQNFKMSLTNRVIDAKNVKSLATKNPGKWLFPPRETAQQDLIQWMGKDLQVMDHILRGHGGDGSESGSIREITTMETLQEEDVVVPLTAEEEQEVQQERLAIQNERTMKKGYNMAGRA